MDAFDSKTARRIVGVSLRQIQYWDERGLIRPSVKLPEGRGSKRLYSFSDLVCLKVVKDLTDHGLSLRKTRGCLNHLKNYPPEREEPSNSLRYLTDGEKLFVLTSDQRKILDAVKRQFVVSLGIGNLVRELNGEVRRLGRGSSSVKLGRIVRTVEGKKAASA